MIEGNMASFCQEKGIIIQTLAPYAHQNNGVVERENQTVMAGIRAMLKETKLAKGWWSMALHCCCYAKNRVTNSSIPKDTTPYQRLYGREAYHGSLRTFGCPVWAHVPPETRTKLDDRAFKGNIHGLLQGRQSCLPSMERPEDVEDS